MAAVGAGILWLGWNGFNGGDPYYAGASAAGAVVNTNLATAVGVLVWIAMDAWLSKERKPTFLGGVNGMICGLVGITPCAGWVSGWGAIIVGATCTVVVWFAQGGRCPGCHLHARHSRPPRWTAAGHLR
jgi:Amt family ammonium transporter